MFRDNSFLNRLVNEVVRKIHGIDLRNPRSFEIMVEHTILVGWTSTAPFSVEEDASGAYEVFKPNHYSTGLRVKRDRQDILAPSTREISLTIECWKARDGIHARIHTLYPGPHIGPLRQRFGNDPSGVADILDREGVVFFDWNHAVEPIDD
jgi:hypothetical protein